jgi:hypothetical protein
LFIQPAQPQFRQTGQVIRFDRWCPRGEKEPYRLREQAAANESEYLGGGPVEPVCIVHDAQQGLLLRRVRQEAERRQGDQKPVGTVARVEPERDAEPAPLGFGERAEPVEQRTAQLVQPGEGELHFRFDADAAGHPEP